METSNFIESYQTNAFDFCDRVIEQLDHLIEARSNPEIGAHFQEGSVTNNGSGNRKDYSFNFAALSGISMEMDYVAGMHDILRQWIPAYGDKYASFNIKPCISNAMKVQKTAPKGGFHTWHFEQSAQSNDAALRNLTWTLYLNDIPEGEGETEFLEYGIKVQPKKGLLTFFPSSWTHTHRGNPVYSCDKYIATGWYLLA